MKRRLQAIPNTRLKTLRQQHHWSQKEMAQLLGTTYITVSRWENGTILPGLYFRKKLCELFHVQLEDLGFSELSSGETAQSSDDVYLPSRPVDALAPSSIWHVPYRRNLLFTGRDTLLAQLQTLFRSSQVIALSQAYALSGLGGVGKTQTALEYAYRYRSLYQTVLWARAETSELFYADMVSIAHTLALPGRVEQEQERIIRYVRQWLATHSSWLLILDNIEDFNLIEDVMPVDYQGHLLLTTRAQATGRSAQRLDLEQMDDAEGALFLLRRAKLLAPDAPLTASGKIHEALEICHELAGLPLALDQAGAYIEETGCGLLDYLQRYRASRARLLARRGSHHDDHPASVTNTFALSFVEAGKANPLAVDLLRFCAFLAPDAIPEEMILQGWPEFDFSLLSTQEIDEFELDDALAILRRYSLLRRNAETKMVTVHRLVQAVVKDQMAAQEQERWARCVVRVVNATLPNVETTSWAICSRTLPHADWVLHLIKDYQIVSLAAAQLLDHMGIYLNLRVCFQEAEVCYLRAQALRVQLFGMEHLETAISLYKLGDFYTDQGKYAEAEPLLLQALKVWEANLDPCSTEVAQTIDSLGKLYGYRGRYTEAEEFLLRAELLWTQLLGAEHPSTANTLHSLAIVYKLQGKLLPAEDAYQRALTIWERKLGPDHPNTAIGMLDLASLYIDLDKHEQSESLLQQALVMQESLLGLEHIDVARTYLNFARLYDKQKKYKEAETYYLRALGLRERLLGLDAPLTANCLHNLAELYVLQERFSDAEAFFLRALAIRQQRLGPEHPYTQATQTGYNLLKAHLDLHEQE